MKIKQEQLDVIIDATKDWGLALQAQIKQLRSDCDKIFQSDAALEKQNADIIRRLDTQVEIYKGIAQKFSELETKYDERTTQLIRKIKRALPRKAKK